MFSLFGITITVAQIIAALPKAIEAFKAAQAAYSILTTVQKLSHDKATQESVSLLGKALAKLVYDAAGMAVPLPHRMTPEEEKLWWDRAQGQA